MVVGRFCWWCVGVAMHGHVKAGLGVQGVPSISPSIKNAIKCGSNDEVTRLVSRHV